MKNHTELLKTKINAVINEFLINYGNSEEEILKAKENNDLLLDEGITFLSEKVIEQANSSSNLLNF